MKTILIFLNLLIGCQFLSAQQLVYKPMNPAFGGDTFNYQWLLSSANAQNPYDDAANNYRDLLKDASSLDSFSQSLNRQLLNQLSSSLFTNQFGNGGIKPGNYLFGSYYLNISESSQGLLIDILDTANGEQSQIIIPRP